MHRMHCLRDAGNEAHKNLKQNKQKIERCINIFVIYMNIFFVTMKLGLRGVQQKRLWSIVLYQHEQLVGCLTKSYFLHE